MSSRSIEDLYPPVQPLFRKLLEEANKVTAPYATFITDGYRSNAEQDELYAQGRTKPGSIVTNARGGQSTHNYGLAVDLAFQKDGKLFYTNDLYQKIFIIARSMGFELGADWASFPDKPHFQYTKGLTIAQLKAGQRPVVSPIMETDMGLKFPLFRERSTGKVYYRAFDSICQYIPNPEELERFWPGVIPQDVDDIKTIGTPIESIISEKNALSAGVLALQTELADEKKKNAELFAAMSKEIADLKARPPVETIKEVIKEVPVPETSLSMGRLFELLVNKIFRG